MKFGVVRFPGSNCDDDCYHVVKNVFGIETDFLWHKDTKELSDYSLIIIPGGFSYGDYLRPGAIAKFSPIIKKIKEYADRGGLIIGICNGFQILLETGLLEGVLIRNKTLNFICKNIHIKIENKNTPFSNIKKDVLKIPIAHKEGCFFCDENTLKRLIEKKQIIFRYSTKNGEITESANPNGSLYSIAGICNEKRNVLGMMPHPERCSEKILGNEDGKYIFNSIINYLKEV